MESLPVPPQDAMFYEDEFVYACLASFPITRGHTIVAWKEPVRDLNMLSRKDYEKLMDVVENVRAALLKVLGVEKVYLFYMDEIQHVHWHLVPRFEEKGFNILAHTPTESHDFSLAPTLRQAMKL